MSTKETVQGCSFFLVIFFAFIFGLGVLGLFLGFFGFLFGGELEKNEYAEALYGLRFTFWAIVVCVIVYFISGGKIEDFYFWRK
jgi:hypothetical protein